MDTGVMSRRMDILLERGLFEDRESLMLKAYRSLLTLQPELKIELALSLYEREEVSFGRAAEIAGVSREEMKEVLASRGMERKIAMRAPERLADDVRFLLERE